MARAVVQIDIDEVTIDDEIYPRKNKSPKTVDEYVEAIVAGVRFPPIEVQRIKDGENTQTILLDGYHRLEAQKKITTEPELFEESASQLAKIDAMFWKEEVLVKAECLNQLRMRAVRLNKHGMPIKRSDMEAIAQKIARDDPEHKISSEQIAKGWDLKDRTVRDWIQSIRAQQTASRDQLIYKLSLLGWTQQEIAAKVGLTQPRVKQIINNGNFAKIYDSLHEWLSKGKSVEEAAQKLEIDATLGWAVYLQDADDDEKLETLNESFDGIDAKPRTYDVWSFGKCLSITGESEYPGRIPGQIVLNTLYFFSKQGDLVVDPMAGGGTTNDACLLMGRRCKAFDISPIRDDVMEQDITSPEEPKKKADLVFLDPPYYMKKADEYNLPDEYQTREGFLKFASTWLAFCDMNIRPSGIAALLISDWVDYDDPKESIFSDEYAELFQKAGYTRLYKISCPLSTQQYDDYDVERAKEKKQLLIRGRELYILRKG